MLRCRRTEMSTLHAGLPVSPVICRLSPTGCKVEHLFTLKQSLDGYRFYKKLITELDEETARLMQAVPSAGKQGTPMPPRTKHTVYQRNGKTRIDKR
jgi:hypothetical protein